jgi:ribonucleoside-diphosphate reductase alpha chain
MVNVNSVDPRNTLGKLVVWDKYASYIPEFERRENWGELALKLEDMYLQKFPDMQNEIREVCDAVRNKQILPSMRSLQFAGKPILTHPNRVYNCSFHHMKKHAETFAEVMYNLLSGSGAGFSVQKHHVAQYPVVKGADKSKTKRYRIHDQIEGWSDAVLYEVKSQFEGTREIEFDYSDIRGPEELIASSGRKAPGPEKLAYCLAKIREIFEGARGRKLRPIEVHDICCWIAWCVVAGGVRRSAMISLFSLDDEEMMNCKAGAWWEQNPQRGRANNSAVLLRGHVDEAQFRKLMYAVEVNRTGEPGLFWTNDLELGTNPCGEISLRDMQFCNLTSVNFATVTSEKDFANRVRLATILGTLQASFTDFLYLRDKWRDNCEDEALLGVSITGMCENLPLFYSINFDKATKLAKKTNTKIAKRIGIKPSARLLTIKPEGTGTLAAGAVTAGIHYGPAKYWIKHFTLDKHTDLYKFLLERMPTYIVDSPYVAHEAYFAIPLSLPDHVTETEENTTAMDTLERIRFVYENWIVKGHRRGKNTHNVSSTVRVRDEEWVGVTDWMWENRERYAAISFLHMSDTSAWTILPQQSISEEQYHTMVDGGSFNGHEYAGWHDIDFDDLIEKNNNVDLSNELACAGGACLI